MFARTRAYAPFAATQAAFYAGIPIFITWVLGGVVNASAIALWTAVPAHAAILLGHRRVAIVLFTVFALGLLLVTVAAPGAPPVAEPYRSMLFVVNLAGMAGVTVLLAALFAGGRAASLDRVRHVVRRYLPADVADAVLADPARLELGGDVVDATVLIADLAGFTRWADARRPDEAVVLLNAYFAEVVPCIRAVGGTVVSFPGDSVVAIFGAPRPLHDHALRGVEAALSMHRHVEALLTRHPSWPRCRIGLNTGPVVVGNIGNEEIRHFTAVGDTVNLAQRLESLAPPGQTVLGPECAARVRDRVVLAPLGPVDVKGKVRAVEPFLLTTTTGLAKEERARAGERLAE